MSLCEDLTGRRFNMLVVQRRVANSKRGQSRWECLCDCGNSTIVTASNLKTGAVKSCGCLKHKKHDTHHLSHTPLCKVWYKMRQRCYSINDQAYKDYGGRGITICDEWKNNFESFYNWSLANGYTDGLTIDRINNNDGYSPQNCRWSTPKEQANNRRSCRYFTFDGKTMNLMQWCNLLNLPYKIVHSRIYKSKWTFERAISQPIKSNRSNGG